MAKGRSGGRGSTAILGIVVFLIQACFAPATAPSAGSTPTATNAPSAAATPTAVAASPSAPLTTNVGEHWAPLADFPDAAHVLNGIGSDDGWVVAGLCTQSLDCAGGVVAGALYSEDTGSWSEATVENPGDTSWMDRVAWNGRFVAAGTQYRLGGTGHWVVVWTSEDGRSWDLQGRIDITSCGDGECPTVGDVSVTRSGVVVLTLASSGESLDLQGVYRSGDGMTWERLPASAFGISGADLFAGASQIVELGERLLLVGSLCADCPANAWTSEDGREWQVVSESGQGVHAWGAIVASGSELVAAGGACGDDACTTEVWPSADGATWTHAASLEFDFAGLAYTGRSFVLLGTDESGMTRVARSVDARTWEEVEHDLTFGDECTPDWMAGYGGHVLVGDPDCGIWRSSDD